MPLLRTTWITQLQRHSFSESWYRDAATADPTVELVAARQYAVARAALLGKECRIYGIRISNVDDKRQKAYTVYVDYPGNQDVDGQGNALHGSAASNVALNCVFINADTTQQRLIQLRGIWDDFEVTGGAPNLGDAVYLPLLQNWFLKVVSLNYRWRYTSSVNKKNIAGYLQKANGLVEFTFDGNFFTVEQVDGAERVPCRISECASSPNLNGQIVVKALSPTSGISLRPIAVRPFVAGGKIQRNLYSTAQASQGRIQRVGNRQAGAPLLQSVGRGPARTRG